MDRTNIDRSIYIHACITHTHAHAHTSRDYIDMDHYEDAVREIEAVLEEHARRFVATGATAKGTTATGATATGATAGGQGLRGESGPAGEHRSNVHAAHTPRMEQEHFARNNLACAYAALGRFDQAVVQLRCVMSIIQGMEEDVKKVDGMRTSLVEQTQESFRYAYAYLCGCIYDM
jgi:hypothetical protein